MTASNQRGTKTVYQLKVTLEGIRPPIWRRIQVRGDITLHKLHEILQVVMGWEGYHLHQFIVGEESYSEISKENDIFADEFKNEKRAKLNKIAPVENFKFIYEYDFGDSWYHGILVEKILQPEEDLKHPICLKGKRASPPEDCGGVPGYYELLEAMKDPEHPEHEHMLEWLGGEFDPEKFEIDEINRQLSKIE
ncbi:MAG TPA: plasmid pRiA4b ORF-3 family protein [Methanotrichaceae archaeon]|nr:plasmid pRiA4b ORF-3 family protein [Methanotrichaceae archaeon]